MQLYRQLRSFSQPLNSTENVEQVQKLMVEVQ